MGALLSRFRKVLLTESSPTIIFLWWWMLVLLNWECPKEPPVDIKALEELDTKIRDIEARCLRYQSNWRKWSFLMLLYVFFCEILYFVLYYFYFSKQISKVFCANQRDPLLGLLTHYQEDFLFDHIKWGSPLILIPLSWVSLQLFFGGKMF